MYSMDRTTQKILTTEHLRNLSQDDIIQLYRHGYELEGHHPAESNNGLLSIIVKEHRETPKNISKMMSQVSKLPMEKELIFSTSMSCNEFIEKYHPWNYNYSTTVLGDIYSCGEAVNLGAKCAKGENLLILDCHVCFPPREVIILINTLERNPNAMITPAISHVDFPLCSSNIKAQAYGARFKISSKNPFEWVWLGAERIDKEYPIPMACACAFAMKKDVFQQLSYQDDIKLAFNFEEERSIRLWRMGHPTLVEPRAVFGHKFGGKPMSNTQEADWFTTRVCGWYVNILQDSNWNKLNDIYTKSWGKLWIDGLEYAKQKYSHLRDMMIKYKDNIDEQWFVKIED